MKVKIVDIETLLEYSLFSFYDPQENTWKEFEINKWTNTIDGLVNYMEFIKTEYYLVFYNGLRFDSQIIEWIIRNSEYWHELSSLELCKKIYIKAQDVINDSNYGAFPEYREFQLSFKIIDLFEIHHYSNKNRMVSLKRLEFEMDMEDIEEMPIHHSKIDLTKEEIQLIKSYCRNDIKATYQFYLITIGETEHPLYKGNNQIQLRQDIETEFQIPCLNYSNAKIGDEIIKKFYCEAKGIQYKQLPKKGTFRKTIALKYCIPKIISFKTKELQDFLKEVKGSEIGINEAFERKIKFYGQTYKFAKGGLHNSISGKIYESDNEFLLIDIDVSGFYPASIINFAYYPFHLGKEFLIGYTKTYNKRIELKPLAKKDKRIKGIVAGLKEAGNCPFGKSGDMDSWLYDKQMLLSTTLTGQFAILMLIEACELAGISVIMANTDGITVRIHKNKVEEFNKIKEEWKTKTVNTINYELEEVRYKKMVFSTVNDYLAIKEGEKTEDSVKLKGDFMKDFELHKNKSARICPIALEKWYVEGIPVEKTIKEHVNIYDFAIRQKATRDFHYEGHSKNGKSIYNKLIRYYVANTGEKLLKIKNPSCTTNAAPVSIIEKKDDGIGYDCVVCNFLPKTTKVEDSNINFDYYIEECNRIIDKIALGGKKRKTNKDKQQLNLF